MENVFVYPYLKILEVMRCNKNKAGNEQYFIFITFKY